MVHGMLIPGSTIEPGWSDAVHITQLPKESTMWIFTSKSFISVVQKPGDTDFLTVRARLKGDIETLFPGTKVEVNKGTDYKYRAKVPREVVAMAMHDQVMALNYSNFKNTVKDKKRHSAYMDVWSAMYEGQCQACLNK
jgi:hypothetical protein